MGKRKERNFEGKFLKIIRREEGERKNLRKTAFKERAESKSEGV